MEVPSLGRFSSLGQRSLVVQTSSLETKAVHRTGLISPGAGRPPEEDSPCLWLVTPCLRLPFRVLPLSPHPRPPKNLACTWSPSSVPVPGFSGSPEPSSVPKDQKPEPGDAIGCCEPGSRLSAIASCCWLGCLRLGPARACVCVCARMCVYVAGGGTARGQARPRVTQGQQTCVSSRAYERVC